MKKMTSCFTRREFWTAVVVAIAAGSLTLSGQTAVAWTMGDPIVSYYVADTLTEPMAQQAVEGGFNIAWINRSEVVGQTEMLAQLNIAQAHGLRGQLHSYLLTPAVLDNPTWRSELLDPLIDAFKAHPAAYSYFIADEPSATQFADLARLKNYIQQRDPNHLVYINLSPNNFPPESYGAPNYQAYLDQYVSTVQPKLISYDNYTFLTTGDHSSYFSNLATIRQTAQQANVPFMNIVQAMGWSDPNSTWAYRLPNPNELRFLNYTTLAYGGQGISYFNYWRFAGATGGIQPNPDGTPTSVFTALKTINPQFEAIAKQVQSLKSIGAYHLGDKPPGTVRLPGESPFTLSPTVPNTTYVTDAPVKGMLMGLFGPDTLLADSTFALVVNLDYIHSVTTTVIGPGPLSVFNATTGQWTPMGHRWADLNLEPGGGILVGLTSAIPVPEPSTIVLLGGGLFCMWLMLGGSGSDLGFMIYDLTRNRLRRSPRSFSIAP